MKKKRKRETQSIAEIYVLSGGERSQEEVEEGNGGRRSHEIMETSIRRNL